VTDELDADSLRARRHVDDRVATVHSGSGTERRTDDGDLRGGGVAPVSEVTVPLTVPVCALAFAPATVRRTNVHFVKPPHALRQIPRHERLLS
jgi:hypothetical protein